MSTKGSGKLADGDGSTAESALLTYRKPHGLVSADLTLKELASTDDHGVAKGAAVAGACRPGSVHAYVGAGAARTHP